MVALKLSQIGETEGRSCSKQERRGGIETDLPHPIPVVPDEKQERRGGIETSLSVGWLCGGGVKQERRGGIETWQFEPPLGCWDIEAGTPWWH